MRKDVEVVHSVTNGKEAIQDKTLTIANLSSTTTSCTSHFGLTTPISI